VARSRASRGAVGQYITGGTTAAVSNSSTATTTTSPTAFITLSDLTTPQVSAAVSEADVAKVQPGEKVNFTLTAYPNQTFTGTVATVEPAGTTASNVVTYTVLVNVDSTNAQLLPGMTATVTIVTDSADNAVLVPNNAISNGNVRVLRNGSPVVVPVQTGITDGVNTQIVSGLQPGDQVITGVVSSTGSASKSSASSGSGGSSSSSRPSGGNIFNFGGGRGG
jgi:multidrug efflux pump subunit AcrA (membrane-fusion protein)